jgi:hypothetical protein
VRGLAVLEKTVDPLPVLKRDQFLGFIRIFLGVRGSFDALKVPTNAVSHSLDLF